MRPSENICPFVFVKLYSRIQGSQICNEVIFQTLSDYSLTLSAELRNIRNIVFIFETLNKVISLRTTVYCFSKPPTGPSVTYGHTIIVTSGPFTKAIACCQSNFPTTKIKWSYSTPTYFALITVILVRKAPLLANHFFTSKQVALHKFTWHAYLCVEFALYAANNYSEIGCELKLHVNFWIYEYRWVRSALWAYRKAYLKAKARWYFAYLFLAKFICNYCVEFMLY